jgi:hypothetical protein
MLCLKYVGIIDLRKSLQIFIIFLLKIVIMKIVSITYKLSTNSIDFLFFVLNSSLVCTDASSDSSVNQCLYKSLYNVYNKMSFLFFALSSFSMRRVREYFLETKKNRPQVDNHHHHRVLFLSNKSQIRANN